MPIKQPQLPQPKSTSTVSPEMASPTPPQFTLQQPSLKKTIKPSKSIRFLRRFRSVLHSFPSMNQPCKMPTSLHSSNWLHVSHHIQSGTTMTGTLYGHRKARVTLAIQENPRCFPILLLELAIPTAKLQQEMGSGLVRIALESEKHLAGEKVKLMEEPLWMMYCNGKKMGYAIRREPNKDDLNTLQLLHAVSMGAGVLPSRENVEKVDGELTYMRADFEHIVGSKDSETFYMVNPDGNSGPELSIFFVRI